ncbi:Nramp family divalent metal transporter [Flammeovirga agarivorans]|uniref:Nramp family divalent metal transporter n=1 Tax=Flammeovirga agarivorans TaxID=2726742 RepID=A0A7X8SGY1_9BACT|nr:Nramp family divalent metal transporter [Flammeovirga agarivorans]NLR89984.1 Nramp family divalent metal transporter [Flammeovirga agarivorans]
MNKLKNKLKYVGAGLLVTVGFIDPGNWATNVEAGSTYGYSLLWVITLSTIMLIVFQHNSAHLGIASGYCLSESIGKYIRKPWKQIWIISAIGAAICTALAELLGGAIALQMLFDIPIKAGAVMTGILVITALFGRSYEKVEIWIVGMVSIIGFGFIVELNLVDVDWTASAVSSVLPTIPMGSGILILGLLGAVVMPHNMFLHSDIIQQQHYFDQSEVVIKKKLKSEFKDTMLTMVIGWVINSAMIIVAAAAFYNHVEVTDLVQAEKLLEPIAGKASSIIFAVALLLAGVSSSVTAGMAGGTIYSGLYQKSYDSNDKDSRIGILITILGGVILIFFIGDPFQALIYSQMMLSFQLPITIILLIYLTSSKKVMGKFINKGLEKYALYFFASVVIFLNVLILILQFTGS